MCYEDVIFVIEELDTDPRGICNQREDPAEVEAREKLEREAELADERGFDGTLNCRGCGLWVSHTQQPNPVTIPLAFLFSLLDILSSISDSPFLVPIEAYLPSERILLPTAFLFRIEAYLLKAASSA